LLADSKDAFTLGAHDYLRGTIDAAAGDDAHAAQGFARAIERIGRSFPEYARLNALAARALACTRIGAAAEGSCPADSATLARTELDAYDHRWNAWLLPAHIALARIDLDAGRADAAMARLRTAIASAKDEVDPAQLNLLVAQAWLAAAERHGGHCDASEGAVRETAHSQGIEQHALLVAAFHAIDAAGGCASTAH